MAGRQAADASKNGRKPGPVPQQDAGQTQHEDEGVCFTAGIQGAPFGAGVIHAYLAARRGAPRVVAGISLGSLTAAAFQRAFRECQKDPGSADTRWQWYRRYLRSISEKPFDVIWSGIPNQSDFFAEFIPVKDPVPETILDPVVREKFIEGELQARRDLTLFVTLGHWVSRMPLKVGSVADFVIQYVRLKEKYGHSAIRRFLAFLYTLLKILFVPVFHTALHPMFINEARFGKKNQWPEITFVATCFMLTPPLLLLGWVLQNAATHPFWQLIGYAVAVTVSAFLLLWWLKKNSRPLLGWPLYGACVSFSLAFFLAGLFVFAWDFWKFAQLLQTTHFPVADGIGRVLVNVNGPLLEVIKEALSLLFLVVFIATLLLVRRIIAEAQPKRRRAIDAGLALPIKKLLQMIFKSQGWGWITVALIVLSLGVVIASGFPGAFSTWLLSLASRLHISDALNTFTNGVSSLIDNAYNFNRRIMIVATAIFLLYLVRKGQPLTASEVDAQRSARRRRRITAFTLPLSTWIALSVVMFSALEAILLLAEVRYAARILFAVFCMIPLVPLVEAFLKEWYRRAGVRIRKWLGFLAGVVFGNLNLHKALVHNYYLRLQLFQLFQEDNKDPILQDDPFPVVLVAAPLQVIGVGHRDLGASQVWANTGSSLVDALTATLALPGLYEPTHLEKPARLKKDSAPSKEMANGIQEKKGLDAWWFPEELRPKLQEVDICDGAVIRQNPIPALFNFIAQDCDQSRDLAVRLSGDGDKPKLHVVYSVPTEAREPDKRKCDTTIVDVGLDAVKLARRRDTQLEVRQTNRLSQMQQQLLAVGIVYPRIHPIFADEIAPDSDPNFTNPLNPTRDEVLDRVAAGCRATLQVLYARDLSQLRGKSTTKTIPCPRLMLKVARRPGQPPEFPGLPEVCQACNAACGMQLKASKRQRGRTVPKLATTWSVLPNEAGQSASLGDKKTTLPLQIQADRRAALDPTDPISEADLDGTKPRIVFVASGGVFRGTFHGGMIAALLTARIKPDLVVGASVGTIMGGALAAAFCAHDYPAAVDHLEELTAVLLAVDQDIAFTKSFKNATRDLGIRARAVAISPNAVRKMVLAGGSKDAGFAAVGAPSALIDSLSHLLLIPHKKTADIAAEFIAGHVTAATKLLLDQLKIETLKRLSIENSLIGTSLIQPTANRLLNSDGVDLKSIQPFLVCQIAVYGTTVDYWRRQPVLLGDNNKDRGPLYDFVESALCSSAFPCVFSTRRESDLYPGTGSSTTLYSDGGMFDNLPFLPAIEILRKAQVKKINQDKEEAEKDRKGTAVDVSIKSLCHRWNEPDLFLAGSLDVNLHRQQDPDNTFDNIREITRRASALQNNVKIKGFEQVMMTIDDQVGHLVEWAQQTPDDPNRGKLEQDFIDGVVNASILPVYPADPEHLNGTFAFCASTGLDQGRLKDSIADGCFQTFKALTDPDAASDIAAEVKPSPLQRSFRALKQCGKIPDIEWQKPPQKGVSPPAGECKFFRCSSFSGEWPAAQPLDSVQNVQCPFFQAADQIEREIPRLKSESAGQLKELKQRERDTRQLAKQTAKLKKRVLEGTATAEDFARYHFQDPDFSQELTELQAVSAPDVEGLEKRYRAIQDMADRISDQISKHKSSTRSRLAEKEQRRDSIREIYDRCITDEVHNRAHKKAKVVTKNPGQSP